MLERLLYDIYLIIFLVVDEIPDKSILIILLNHREDVFYGLVLRGVGHTPDILDAQIIHKVCALLTPVDREIVQVYRYLPLRVLCPQICQILLEFRNVNRSFKNLIMFDPCFK